MTNYYFLFVIFIIAVVGLYMMFTNNPRASRNQILPKTRSLTHEEHKDMHQEYYDALLVLLDEFEQHSPNRHSDSIDMLVGWAKRQANNPTHEPPEIDDSTTATRG